MNDHDREERAVWKLEQGGYHVTKQDGRYLLTTAESITELDTLAELVAFAETVYERVWTGRKITPERLTPAPGASLVRPFPPVIPMAYGILPIQRVPASFHQPPIEASLLVFPCRVSSTYTCDPRRLRAPRSSTRWRRSTTPAI